MDGKQGISVCPDCHGQTIQFKGEGKDAQYRICPRYKEAGHLTESEIESQFQQFRRLSNPSGRFG